jgi:hypothetical protein
MTGLPTPTDDERTDDAPLAVATAIADICKTKKQTPQELLGSAIRQAIDDVIDGPRTGRWTVADLEKTEKTYIGTRVEIIVRNALGLERKGPLDTWIAGIPVDIKFSISSTWAIPREAVGQVCVVLGTDKAIRRFKVGVVRCNEELLNPGRNQDEKRGLSKRGRAAIIWITEDGSLKPDFLSELPNSIRDQIFAETTGQARIRKLVMLWQDRPIPRVAIETIAQQKDPMRRLRRDSTDRLGGLWVLSGRYDSEIIETLGLPRLAPDEFISIDPEKYGDTLSGFKT